MHIGRRDMRRDGGILMLGAEEQRFDVFARQLLGLGRAAHGARDGVERIFRAGNIMARAIAETECEKLHEGRPSFPSLVLRANAHSAITAASVSAGRKRCSSSPKCSDETSWPSAQTAIARTRAEGLSSFEATSPSSAESPLLPAAIKTLRVKRSKPMRLTAASGKKNPKGGIVKAKQIGDWRRGKPLAFLQLGFARGCREFVPGTDGETIVAAENAVFDERPEFAGDMPLMFDR